MHRRLETGHDRGRGAGLRVHSGMVPWPVTLVLVIALLGCEWFYIRTFFQRVEPVLIARVERWLDVEIGFGLRHHWEVRRAGPDRSASPGIGLSLAVLGIQIVVMIVFALGILVIAGLVFAPVIWLASRD